MSRTNETRHIEWHKTCKCKCRLDPSVCNNKQHWNEDKCRCECKELIDKGVCDKGFIWNPSNCEYELVEECTETNNEVKLTKITLAENRNKHKWSSCTLCIVFYFDNFVYSHSYLKNYDARVMLDTRTETRIYWNL